jgi:hypothetical protein
MVSMGVTTNLVTKHALSVMVENLPNLSGHLDEIRAISKRHGYFPDGSLFIEGENCLERLADFIYRHALGVAGVWQPKGFGGLKEFGGKHCFVWYTNDYRDRLGEEDLQIRSPNEVIWPEPPTYCLSDLLITVVFRGKPSTEMQLRFAECIGAWSHHVSSQGFNGEGAIKLIASQIEYRKKVAQFRIDASQSGQDTLNWLVLTVLNFGYAFSLVSNIFFDHEQNTVLMLEGIQRPLEVAYGKAKVVPIAFPPAQSSALRSAG